MSILVIAIVLALVCVMVYDIWKHSVGHTVVSAFCNVSPDAEICSVTSERESSGKQKYIRTTVKFTDGVEFYTYKTRTEPGLMHINLILDNEVREEIIADAMKAHEKLVRKQEEKRVVS